MQKHQPADPFDGNCQRCRKTVPKHVNYYAVTIAHFAVASFLCFGFGCSRDATTPATQDAGAKKPETKQEIVASFKKYIENHIQNYGIPQKNENPYGDGRSNGWKHYSAEIDPQYTMDIQETTSLVTPCIGVCEFLILSHSTKEQSQSEASKDHVFVSTSRIRHKHTYAFQDGQWIPKTCQYTYGEFDNGYSSVYDCQRDANASWCWKE